MADTACPACGDDSVEFWGWVGAPIDQCDADGDWVCPKCRAVFVVDFECESNGDDSWCWYTLTPKK